MNRPTIATSRCSSSPVCTTTTVPLWTSRSASSSPTATRRSRARSPPLGTSPCPPTTPGAPGAGWAPTTAPGTGAGPTTRPEPGHPAANPRGVDTLTSAEGVERSSTPGVRPFGIPERPPPHCRRQAQHSHRLLPSIKYAETQPSHRGTPAPANVAGTKRERSASLHARAGPPLNERGACGWGVAASRTARGHPFRVVWGVRKPAGYVTGYPERPGCSGVTFRGTVPGRSGRGRRSR